MLILSINLQGDPAGVGINLVNGINKHTNHKAIHIIDKTTFLDLKRFNPISKKDMGISVLFEEGKASDENRELIRSADILHFNQFDWTHFLFEPYLKIIGKNQKMIFHGHGGSWLLNPMGQINRCKARGAFVVTCSPMDEAVFEGEKTHWIPNVMPLDDDRSPNWDRDFKNKLYLGLPANHNQGLYKGATMVRYMVDYLREEHGFQIYFELITGMKIDESLRNRRNHHFTVDNWVQGFHGMAGIEGLALGHVVFSRFDPLAHKKWSEFSGEMIPIDDVKGFDTCAKRIREYYHDRDMLLSRCKSNRAWMEKYYSEERLVKTWADFYEKIAGEKAKPFSFSDASNPFVAKMFHDSIASPPKPERILDGIMGNADYDEYERGEILKLLKSLKIETSGKILDAGAGIGRNIPTLKEAGFVDIEAVDFAPAMVGKFKERFPDIRCEIADLTNLGMYPDDYFETTFCMYVIIHITDDTMLEKAISEMERVTKGSLIVGAVFDPQNKPNHQSCHVREYFEIHPIFSKKKLDHWYENLYEIPFDGAVNRVSFAVLK